MVAGRKPKPTPLRVIEGNRGHRPLPKDEPQPRSDYTPCPIWLKGKARQEWKRITPELRRLGLLTVVDRAALAAYCQAYARWVEAEAIIEEKGLTFETDSGYVQQRPEVPIAQKSMQIMKAFATEFGLTPASRTRISVSQKPGEKDPMEPYVD